MKRRLDEEIVRRGLVSSRNEAKTLVLEGKILVNGRKAVKPSESVKEEDVIEVVEPKKYVSRGGYKLEFALDVFNIDVNNKVCADIGSSTGGFTDCLLRRGAKKVYAIDVGENLLDISLRNNPKIVLIENFNARYLSKEIIGETLDIVTIDVSFISILKLIGAVLPLLSEDGEIISLIKPQFEGQPKFLRKGVVKEKSFHKEILTTLLNELRKLGVVVIDATYSPLKGGKGNIEFFFRIKNEGVFVKDEIIDKIVEEAWEKSK